MIRIMLFVVLLIGVSLIDAHPANPLSHIRYEDIVRHLDSSNIVINTDQLHGVGQVVNVSFTGFKPLIDASTNFIGLWSPRPANNDYSKVAAIKYIEVKPDSNGDGTVPLWFLNMRAEFVACLFTGSFDKPVIVAESKPVQFTDTNRPMHVHLALTGNPTEMRVDWTSSNDDSYQPWIKYGTNPRSLDLSALVKTTTYTANDMCGAPATTVGWRDPGFFHKALLEGLKPNTQYYYQVGDSSKGSESVVYNFFAPPAPDQTDIQFVIFGDLGQVETDGSNEASQMVGSKQTTDALIKDVQQGVINLNMSAAVFHIGDISYARGYASLWEQFFYQLSSIQPRVPWMTLDGNHERDFPGSLSLWNGTDSGGECGIASKTRFSMPIQSAIPQPFDQTWWSVDFGPAHFTSINTEMDFTPGSLQYLWIEQDWRRLDRKKTPFLILAGHRPMYIDSTNDSPNGGDTSVGQLLIDSLEPLMRKYQVDVAFWGHHHSYQRTCAVHNFTCVDETEGTIHIVTGAAGADFSTNLYPQQPDWIKFVNASTHGYIIANVKQANTLKLDFIHATERTVMDTVTIKSKFLSAIDASE